MSDPVMIKIPVEWLAPVTLVVGSDNEANTSLVHRIPGASHPFSCRGGAQHRMIAEHLNNYCGKEALVFDEFDNAMHPTLIAKTVEALVQRVRSGMRFVFVVYGRELTEGLVAALDDHEIALVRLDQADPARIPDHIRTGRTASGIVERYEAPWCITKFPGGVMRRALDSIAMDFRIS